MAGKTIVWNGVSSDSLDGVIIGKVTRSVIGRPRTTLLEIAGKAGFYTFPQERGSRLITAEVSVSTASGAAHDTAMEEFADWLDVESEARLKIGNGDRYYQGVVRDSPIPDEWNGLSTFEVVWEVQPYAYADDVGQEIWSDDNNHVHTWDAGIEVPVKPVITIQPTNGTLYAFQLGANSYDLYVENIAIASGEFVTVNSIVPVVLFGPNDDVQLTGVYDPGDLAMGGTSGSFPILVPGGSNTVNFIRTNGTATAFSITTSYRATYRR